MSIGPIKSINFFENTKQVQGYTPAPIPSKGQEKAQKGTFAQDIDEVAQIGMQKAEANKVGLGGTNSPIDSDGNKHTFFAIA